MWKGQQLLDIMFPSISFLLNLTFYRDGSDLWRLVCFGVYQFSVSRDYNFKNYHFYEKVQKRIQNLVKHLRWTFAKRIMKFQPITSFTKNSTCGKKNELTILKTVVLSKVPLKGIFSTLSKISHWAFFCKNN